MIGHGSPNPSRGQNACCVCVAACRSYRFVLTLTSVLMASLPAASSRTAFAQESIRVRIAWGGGAEKLWQGTISVTQGTIAEPRPLGIEADGPGSMWLETDQHGTNRLVIRQRSRRAYDGVDLLVTANNLSETGPEQPKLLVELAADQQRVEPITIALADLLGGFSSVKLDNQGNRLLARRTPGDKLRLKLVEESLVFSPGETLRFELRPHLLALKPGTKVEISVQLVAGRSQRLIGDQHPRLTAVAGQPVTFPLEIPLPNEEGVYELVIKAAGSKGLRLPQGGRMPLGWKQTVAERKLQFLVIQRTSPAMSAGIHHELGEVVQIDPANPKWWERFAKLPQMPQMPRLQRLWKGPLGSGHSHTRQHPLGQLVELAPNAKADDVSWEAYTLPIDRPGLPHVLEVDYPSDLPQTLGISILEPNAAGALMPIGVDSGVDLTSEVADTSRTGPPRWVQHRLVFWPRTKTPMVLITNRRKASPAVYGKIRVLAGWAHLPRAFSTQNNPTKRVLAAYLDRPLFPETFSATEFLDAWSNRSLDDWVTFYQGGTRLVEYLNYVGLNGLMISVLADGSTIYPSKVLQPTPRYDTGAFFATGQDPIRKDVLEMLLRLFDREDLQLIPALEFAAPLPELEAILRRRGPESVGIEWVGPEGLTLPQVYPPRRGLAPYYNVLHPRVQEAMLAVVRELVGAYAHHQSFVGLAIQLSARGYAQLPGPDWGLDDETIARFQRDTGLQVPGSGPNRFADRAEFLASPQNRQRWLQWRSNELSRFHRRIQSELTAIRPDGRLYLAGANMLTGEEMEYQLRPALPRRITIADALLQVGIDVAQHRDAQAPLLLRPEWVASGGPAVGDVIQLEVNQMPDLDRTFREVALPGSLFFHRPREARVASFDQKSPFRPSYTWLFSQPMPSDEQNRRRFVHSLATLDSQAMFDGGWLLPLGQEDSIRDLVAGYRQLPAVPLKRVSDPGGGQPVTIRYGTHQDRTFVYAVNDAPFPVSARVAVRAPAGCQLEELTRLRRVAPLKHDANGTYWTVRLKPYDLVVVALSAPNVELSRPQVTVAGEVHTALDARIRELGARAAALRNPSSYDVLDNPGFEVPPGESGQIPGWTIPLRPGIAAQLDTAHKCNGTQSLKLASKGPIASLVCKSFDAPKTGRLSMWVWLRAANAASQPELRLALEGSLRGRNYDRFALVGAKSGVPIGVQWAPYVFQVDDLPLRGLSNLRIRLDLLGPGEVWIDDIRLVDLAFNENELRELAKLITLADVKRQNGQLRDCIRLLEGYWPHFLEANVPLKPAGVARKPARPQPKKPPEQPKDVPGLLERMKDLLPKKLW